MDAHKAGGGGGGEVRRINVVYFLSRGGRTDHPHLFRVNHRAGVRLRDVKRWLSELRGKDTPDNYPWSYKRKYKAGYVWQDLKEDDLITPISDNEYVLKGCDVRGTPPPCVQVPKRTHSIGEKKQKEVTPCNDDRNRPVEVVLRQDSDESSPKPPPPPPTDQDSPGGCESARLGATAAPFKAETQQQGLHEHKQKQQGQEHDVVIKIEVSRSSQDHQQQQQEEEEEEEEEAEAEEADAKAVARAAPAEQQPQGAGGVGPRHAVGQQARRMRVARALHNILTCGVADADDAALRPVVRRQGRSAAEAGPGDDWPPTPTCPGMDGCGLRVSRTARSRRGGKDKQGKRDGATRDAYKPATLPRCSQCGKEFKPQELHAHMQSCRGFKERVRSSTGGARASVDRRRNATAGRRSKRDHHYSPERSSSASAVFLLTES